MNTEKTYQDLLFLTDEVRDGFYIPTAVKQAWWEEIYILREIDRVCKKHDIMYFADWGTLLAAVRHGGFIPWDDDLDICMKRADYERFRQYQDELPDGFFVQDYTNTSDHWYFIAKVVAKNSISFDEDHLGRFYNFPYMVNVDIFVMDNIYHDHDRETQRDKDTMFIIALADGINDRTLNDEAAEISLRKVNSFFGTDITFIDRSDKGRHDLAVELYSLAEKMMGSAPADESDQLMNLFPWGLKSGYGRPSYLFEKTVRLPYENTTIPVSYMYNSEASCYYGAYMNVVKNWNGHDYPFFEGQKRNLEEINGGPLPFEFRFDASMLRSAYPSENRPPHDKRRVLFLACGRGRWDAFLPFLRDEIKEGSDITVLYLPYFFKSPSMEIEYDDAIEKQQIDAAIAEMPDEFRAYFTRDYRSYDLSDEAPDAIYIEDPYDDRNPSLTIPPEFYTRQLQQVSDIIAFVSPYAVADFDETSGPDMAALRYYVDEPAVISSDWVFVQTDNMRTHYIDELTRFAGENTREYWENVVQIIEPSESTDDALENKILYCIGLSRYTESVTKSFDYDIDDSADVTLFPPDINEWKPYVTDEEIARITLGRQIVSFSSDYYTRRKELSRYSSYCGDPSPIQIEFTQTGRPVSTLTASERHAQREMVFMPYKASMWDSLESIYLAAAADPDTDAYVVPIPYYDRKPDLSLGTYHCESGELPSYIPVTDYRLYDLNRHPDAIFIHNPYDDVNTVTSVDPHYYSSELTKYTDCLVDVPYYVAGDWYGPGQSLLPGYVNADYMVLQDERFIDCIDQAIPMEKLLPLGSPKLDRLIRLCSRQHEEHTKKVYLYNTSISEALNDTAGFLGQMKAVFRMFRDRDDAVLRWRPHPLLESTMQSMRPAYLAEYEELKQRFINDKIGIYDDTPDISQAIADSDAMITMPASSLCRMFAAVGKPMYTPSADGLVPLQENVYAANMDGTAGEKIYESIKSKL